MLNISKYYSVDNTISAILAIGNTKKLKLKIRVKFSFILRTITYMLIIGHIGITSIFYTQQITSSDSSFTKTNITIEKQMILDDIEKDIEDQFLTQNSAIFENPFSAPSKIFYSTFFFNSHQEDICTPPPKVLS